MPDLRKPSEILRAARARIEDPVHWNVDGNRGPDRKTCCALQALYLEDGLSISPAYRFLTAAARSESGVYGITMINSRGHSHALALYDRAIAAAEAEGR